MEHALNVKVATHFDTDTALFLQNIKYWTFKNLSNKKHIHNGLCWTYDSLDALCDAFPYWSRRQIERVINNCIKHGLLVKGNYNSTTYDRTCWYAMTPKAYWFYPELAEEKYLKALYLSISPNGEMDFTEWRNGFPRTVTTIPDTNPPTDPNNNSLSLNPNSEPQDVFTQFWEEWPIKQNKKRAMQIWKKNKLDKIGKEIITHVKLMKQEDTRWKDGFIPNCSTYLNGERWLDEPFKQNSNAKEQKNSLQIKAKSDYQNNQTLRSQFVQNEHKNSCSSDTIALNSVKESFTEEELKKIDVIKHINSYPNRDGKFARSFFKSEEEYKEAVNLYVKATKIWNKSIAQKRVTRPTSVASILQLSAARA